MNMYYQLALDDAEKKMQFPAIQTLSVWVFEDIGDTRFSIQMPRYLKGLRLICLRVVAVAHLNYDNKLEEGISKILRETQVARIHLRTRATTSILETYVEILRDNPYVVEFIHHDEDGGLFIDSKLESILERNRKWQIEYGVGLTEDPSVRIRVYETAVKRVFDIDLPLSVPEDVRDFLMCEFLGFECDWWSGWLSTGLLY